MKKINFYLFRLTNKYLIINFIIVSLFILFINLLELSRVIDEENKSVLNFIYLSLLKYPSEFTWNSEADIVLKLVLAILPAPPPTTSTYSTSLSNSAIFAP